MFKPTKKKPSKAKEKVDFKLEFHATKVPQRGWDKLLVSLISLETNKVTAKTTKSPVKNGSCLWPEPVYESPLLSQDPAGKDTTKAAYKLLVSMGLSRFGILGETTIDLADYMQTVIPVSLSLQLQNCSAGSILHVKIQRIGLDLARRGLEDQLKMQKDHQHTVVDASEPCLDHVDAGPLAIADKEDCVSTSCLSSDSLEAPRTPEVSESRPYGRERRGEELASPCSSIGSCSGRQELGNSFQEYVRFSESDMTNQPYEYTSPGKDGNLYFSPSHPKRSTGDANIASCQFEPSHVKDRELEAAESTLKELRLQSAVWEQKFKQMEEQKELLERQHLEDMTRNKDLQRSLTLLKEERDSVRLEMHNIRFAGGNIHDRGGDGFKLRELQDELDYEKNVNSNLSLQLKKTQESNSELLLEIQDLEKLLHEKGNHEVKSKDVVELKNADKDLNRMVDSLKNELAELERDSHELTEENMNLISQLKQANEKLKMKEDVIKKLELKIDNASHLSAEMEAEKLKEAVDDLTSKLRECEESYESKLSSGRTLIDDLNSSIMMVRSKNARLERELQSSEEHISELLKEIESLKLKMEGLERERSQFVSQKGQLNAFREKASKAEQEHKGALKRVEELETINRELKVEKTRDLTAVKKQLQEVQEHNLAADGKYKNTLQALESLRKEKSNLDKEISALLSAKEAAEANVTQLQSFNMVLQEKLHLEQGKNAELLQQCKEMEAKNTQLFEDTKGNMSQIKAFEQRIMAFETSAKEMEGRTGNLQDENFVCLSRIKELEAQLETWEEEKLGLQSSKFASEARLQEFQALNEELSEKLKNAQEDIDWARENTNTLVNEIRELEAEIKSDMVVQQHLKESLSELESQKLDWQSQLDELSNKNKQLEKEILALEEHCKDVIDEKNALLITLKEQKVEQNNAEASFQSMIKQQEDKIQQLVASASEHTLQQAQLDASVLRDEKQALEKELKNLQDLLMQAKKDVSDSEKKVKHALLEASMRTDEKLELEGNVLKLEQMLKQAEKDVISLKQNLDFQFQEATMKEQEMMKKLNKLTTEAQVLQDEKLEFLQKIMALEAQCSAAELERRKLSMAMSKMETDLEALQKEKKESERAFSGLKEEKESLKVSLGTVFKIESDLEALKKEKEVRERAFMSLKEEKERLEVSLRIVEQEMATLQEQVKSYADASTLWEQSKALLKESTDELNIVKQQNRQLDLKLSEEHLEKEELKKTIAFLEEELQRKAAVMASMEIKVKGSDTSIKNGSPVSPLINSPSRAKGGAGALSAIPSACEAWETADFREKVYNLEGELKLKVFELELSRQQLREQQAQLSLKTEELEVAKQQVLGKESTSAVDQLVKEINSLQDENAALCQRKIELLSTQEALQRETESLKEEKRILELALTNFNAAADGDILSQKITALEMELAEVLEANNMYKKELQSAFAKQHNVQMAALEKLGNVDKVLQDLADLKRRNMSLEDELKDMQQRYFNMSLQFAEVEAEREELVMTIRNLRGAKNKKLTPHKSINF